MRKLTVKREQIGSVIETAFRRWLSSTDEWDLVEAGIHQRVGVTLYWRVEGWDLTLRDISAEMVTTFGTPYEPHHADFEIPRFVGYLPHVPLIRRTHRESDISQSCSSGTSSCLPKKMTLGEPASTGSRISCWGRVT